MSTVPQHATYTVTQYDTSGGTIGNTTIINRAAQTLSAANGLKPAQLGSWTTLSSSVESAFRNPAGSQSGTAPSVARSCTGQINGTVLPLAPSFIPQVLETTPTLTYGIVDWSPVAAGTGTYSDTLTAASVGASTIPALSTGVSRQIWLDSVPDNNEHIDNRQYNN